MRFGARQRRGVQARIESGYVPSAQRSVQIRIAA
jgi:hypothetical protein